MTQTEHDVVVVGGGAAGLNAALVLARSRRSVVVVDGGRVVEGTVASVVRTGDGRSAVALDDGRTLTGRRLVVATGLVDELPDVPGVHERWGRDVLHCPYCHGWEVRDRAVVVLASSPVAVHQALLFRQLTEDLVLLTAGSVLEPEQSAQLRARTGFLAGLGLEPVQHPSGVAEHLAVDATGRTSVAGVWAAGNVADPSAQVGASAAAGAFAAAQVNADLVQEDVRDAVARVAA